MIKQTVKFFFFWCISASTVLCCIEIQSKESVSVSVEVLGSAAGEEIWVTVVLEDDNQVSTEWRRLHTSNFSVVIPNSPSQPTLVVLKKNYLPVLRSLSKEEIANGVKIEFSKGRTIVGSVVAQSDGAPIIEGQISISFDGPQKIPFPKETSVFSRELTENGTFEIQGIPLGEHTLTVVAPGYMPMDKLVSVFDSAQPIELQFVLAKAEFVQGRVVDQRETALQGDIAAEVTPADSQTTEIEIDFELDNSFQLGPFAENAKVELVANLPDGRRSRAVQVEVPIENVELEVHRWVRVSGKVQERETGEPIPNYKLGVSLNHVFGFDVYNVDGYFEEEIIDESGNITIEAPNHVYWVSQDLNLRGKKTHDFGTIELDRAHSLLGRVLDRTTRKPIEGATVLKVDSDNEPPYIISAWQKTHFLPS